MGCGCGKKRNVLSPSVNSAAPVRTAVVAPKTYDVLNGEGTLVASSTNPVLARAEARRTGGTVVPRTTTSTSSA